MGPNQTDKLLHSKGNQKDNLQNGRKWFQAMQQTRASSLKYTNNIYNLTAKKPTTQCKKMGKKPEQIFLQRRYTDDQEAHEKMLNIPDYQRNAHENDLEIPPHTSQNGHH